jgi:hypothetical protein
MGLFAFAVCRPPSILPTASPLDFEEEIVGKRRNAATNLNA